MRPLPPRVLDPALALVVAVVGAVELASLHPDRWGWGVLLECLACLVLVVRRAHPFLAGTVAPLLVLVIPYVGPKLDEPATPIVILALSVYALARWLSDLRGLVGVALIYLMLLGDYVFADDRPHSFADVVFVSALFLPPFVLGRVTRRLAEHNALLREREELVTREAVRAERDRIARELHDVIAHSVSAMVVQTAAAQDLVRSDPAKAEEVLRTVADAGRQALVETGRLLHVIRDDADELGLSPAPGVADLAALVGRFRESGLEVALEVDDGLAPLPAGIDVSAYRIAEEALTNALRHGSGPVRLQVLRSDDGVAIEVSNVPRERSAVQGAGLGLRGMAERVALLGGTLTHGVVDGRFELAARLPVEQP